jgi:sulfotransferase
MNQLVALSGLPRTGSTLLTSILSQNPAIHAGQNSPLCQLAWDLAVSAEGAAAEQMRASNRDVASVVRGFAKAFYANVSAPVVVDKCRSWTLEPNMNLLRMMTDIPKVIVMVRPMQDVVASLVAARRKAGWVGDIEAGIMRDGSEPVMRSLAGVQSALMTDTGEFLFVQYDDLIDRPEQTVAGIYKFCGWTPFAHDFTNIVNLHPEPDDVYGIDGFHEVRPTLWRRHLDVVLRDETVERCKQLDWSLYGALRTS